MTDGPQATESVQEEEQEFQTQQKFNPVLEALEALQDLGRMIDEVHLTTAERIQARCAQAVGWSLLGSVSGGASINIGTSPPSGKEGETANALEQQAKAAFGG